MSKLYMTVKKKKEAYGITKHDFYHVIIPYKIVEGLGGLQSMTNICKKCRETVTLRSMNISCPNCGSIEGYSTFLFGTISTKTGTIRLHTKQHKESTRIQVRQFLTKTYKNQRYVSTKITIPIKFIKELRLKKGDNLDINNVNTTITIKKQKANLSVHKTSFFSDPVHLILPFSFSFYFSDPVVNNNHFKLKLNFKVEIKINCFIPKLKLIKLKLILSKPLNLNFNFTCFE